MDYLKDLNSAQKQAVEATEGPVLVLAGAGAGKTKTIAHRIGHLIAQGVAPQKILAVTFTNKAAKEMRERVVDLLQEGGVHLSYGNMPTVLTFHALGVMVLREHATTLDLPRHFTILDRSDSLRAIKEAEKVAGVDPKQFEPRTVLSAISKQKGKGVTLQQYAEYAGNQYAPRVIAEVWGEYQKIVRREKALDFDDLLLVTLELLRHHKGILEEYQNRWSYLHIDEYQDTNKVQYELVRLLAAQHKNIFCVGDVDQCLVAGTMVTLPDGLTRPIELIQKGEEVLANFGSGDFRPARVSDVFSRTHHGTLIKITLTSGRTLTSTPEHTHFAGFKLGIVPQKYFTYLMKKQNVGFRLGVSQVYTNGQRLPMVGFQQRCNHEHADSVWVISAHETPNEARILEYTLSLQYKIPTLPFVARKGLSKNGYVHDQESLDKIFETFDTKQAGIQLLHDHGLSEQYPHHRAQATNSSRRNIILTLCGDRRGKTPMHRIAIAGSDEDGRKKLESIGLSVRSAKKGSTGWRFETANKTYGTLQEIIARIQEVMPHAHIIEMARLGGAKLKPKDGNSLPFLPAGSVVPGMAMFDGVGGYDIVEKVERIEDDRVTVYDLNIEDVHNFIANGIVTHNSIYTWRGASVDTIMQFEKHFPDATIVKLEQNYRSTKIIVSASNTIIEKNKNRKKKELFTENAQGEKMTLYMAYDEDDEARFVAEKAHELTRGGVQPEEIAVLYRANFQSRALEDAMLARGVPYRVLGTRFFERKEIKDTLAYIRAALSEESTGDVRRIINVPPRGIGAVTVEKFFSLGMEALSPVMRSKIDDFFVILQEIRDASREKKVSELVRFAFARSGLEQFYKKEDEEERLENVRELVTLATKKYDPLPTQEEGVELLLADAALASDQDELEQKRAGVTLMTVHAAKGLEFPYVFITGMEDGLFPHQRLSDEGVDEEEERRLFYVALTRAMKKVFLSYANIRTIYGSRQARLPSEFVTDLDERFLEVAEELASHEPRGKVIYLEM